MRKNTETRIREEVDVLGIPPQDMLKREIARMSRKEAYKKLIRGMLVGLLVIATAIILITNLWLPVFQIEGSSMNPLLRMDQIVVAVRGDNPEKQDIIAFTHDHKINVKRVIATAGDTVDINSEGVVSVNGEVLNEPYVTELSLGLCDIELPFTVPSGTVFVLGDNRSNSLDSRSIQVGTVSREQIIGKVKFSVWPLSRIGSVS